MRKSEWNVIDSGCRRKCETSKDVTLAIGKVKTISQHIPHTRRRTGAIRQMIKMGVFTDDEVEGDVK